MTTIQKPKHESKSKLKKECRELLSRYVRLRDSMKTTETLTRCRCISCEALKGYSEMQAGHYVDARWSATLFNLMNVNSQCPRCNIFLDGNKIWYRRALVRLYGEDAIRELEDMSKENKSFTVSELEKLKAYFTEKIKELQKVSIYSK